MVSIAHSSIHKNPKLNLWNIFNHSNENFHFPVKTPTKTQILSSLAAKQLFQGDIVWVESFEIDLTRWGLNAEDGQANEHLHEVKLDILCNRECHRIFKSAKMIGGGKGLILYQEGYLWRRRVDWGNGWGDQGAHVVCRWDLLSASKSLGLVFTGYRLESKCWQNKGKGALCPAPSKQQNIPLLNAL